MRRSPQAPPALGALGVLRVLRVLGMTLLALVGAVPAAAQEAGVHIVSPPPGRSAFETVTFEAEVVGREVSEVVFLVDGRELRRFRKPPYRAQVDLGDDVGAHRFEVVVLGPAGELRREVRETPALEIDERIDLALQQLYVSVEGRAAGRALRADDFVVRDAGARQRIVTFETGDAALAVALVVDASESMRGERLAAALAGARSFMNGMRALDEASIVLFSDSIRYRSPFTQDADELAPALAEVEAGGGTALNDALFLAIRGLESRQGRRVVVLLSDGVDIHSALRARDVLWTMRRCRSLVYWIALADGDDGSVLSMWRDVERHAEERAELRRLVEESGGRVIEIETVDRAGRAFAEILAELRRQYVIGYYPTVDLDDGAWHPVAVRLKKKSGKLRTRGGYLDY